MNQSEPEDTGPRFIKLVDSLGEPNWRARKRAVQSLSDESSEELVERVLAVLREEHQDPARLNAAIQILAATPVDIVPALQSLMADPDPDLRCYAALTLGERGDPRAIQSLVEALADSQTNVRAHAMDALGKLRAAAAVDELMRFVDSQEFELAFPALDALREIADDRIGPRLVPLLSNSLLQQVTIETLGAVGNDETVPLLLEKFHDPVTPPGIVAQAIHRIHDRYQKRYGSDSVLAALRQVTNPQTVSIVRTAISQASSGQRESLVFVLSSLPGKEAEEGLIECLDQADLFDLCIEGLARRSITLPHALIPRLKSLDLQIEPAFIELIGRVGDLDCVPQFLRLLESEDENRVIAALHALGSIRDGLTLERLQRLLGHPSLMVRDTAVLMLKHLAVSETLEDLRRIMEDSSPFVRESGLKALAGLSHPEEIDWVLKACADPEERVRRAALECLGKVDADSAVKQLKKALTLDTPPVRATAASALSRFDRPEVIPLVLTALNDDDVWVRYYAVRSLAKLDAQKKLGEQLRNKAQHDEAMQVRIAATESLARYGADMAPVLTELSAATNAELAGTALVALGTIKLQDGLPTILRALGSGNSVLCISAIRALGASGLSQAVEPLERIALGSDKVLSTEAMAALVQLQHTSGIEALLRIANWPKLRGAVADSLCRSTASQIKSLASLLPEMPLDVRRLVVEALSRIGSHEAIDALKTGLEDPEPAVRHSVQMALREIRPNALQAHASSCGKSLLGEGTW